MNTISIKKFGLAFGITGAILYLGCVVVMASVGHDGAVKFFNSILHGLDVSSIIRMQVSWVEALIGIVETFIIAWFIGSCIACFYNISFIKEKKFKDDKQ